MTQTEAPATSTPKIAPGPTGPARVPIVYQPRSAVFWLYVITLVVSTYLLLSADGSAFGMVMDAQLWLAPLWIAFIVVLFWLMFTFDPYRSTRRYPQALLAGTALGGTTALVMAVNGNTALAGVWSRYLSPEIMAEWEPALTAPIIEEASKGMCAAVILVLCSSVFHRISHALLVGMFVGFGFDVMEDLTYATREAIYSLDSDLAGAIPNLVGRVLTAVPAHWAYTGLFAVGVMLLLPTFTGPPQWSYARRVLLAVPLMAAASFMHFFWDSPVGGAFVKIAVTLVVFLIPVLWLLRFERQWVTERIATGRADGTFAAIPADILDALPRRRARRRLRRQAKQAGGRRAKKAMRRAQNDALDMVQLPA